MIPRPFALFAAWALLVMSTITALLDKPHEVRVLYLIASGVFFLLASVLR